MRMMFVQAICSLHIILHIHNFARFKCKTHQIETRKKTKRKISICLHVSEDIQSKKLNQYKYKMLNNRFPLAAFDLI